MADFRPALVSGLRYSCRPPREKASADGNFACGTVPGRSGQLYHAISGSRVFIHGCPFLATRGQSLTGHGPAPLGSSRAGQPSADFTGLLSGSACRSRVAGAVGTSHLMPFLGAHLTVNQGYRTAERSRCCGRCSRGRGALAGGLGSPRRKTPGGRAAPD
jgi:hypothetical protein